MEHDKGEPGAVAQKSLDLQDGDEGEEPGGPSRCDSDQQHSAALAAPSNHDHRPNFDGEHHRYEQDGRDDAHELDTLCAPISWDLITRNTPNLMSIIFEKCFISPNFL